MVCEVIEWLGSELIGREIEDLMANFGTVAQKLAQHPQLRWLGPHKGVVHLALASLTNACFDLWAKSRGVPLWRLLLDLDAENVVDLLDLSYLEEVLPREEAERILRDNASSRAEREGILRSGYPGYDTSVGWFQYDDDQVKKLTQQAIERGFHAFKLKVGSRDGERDVRRAFMLRELAGENALIMLDANQQWTLPRALEMCHKLREMSPFFVEEPTHPDDIRAHRTLAEAIKPIPIALGEHVPNRIMFKNFMQAGAVQIVQVDCTRVAGISEFLTVSLLAKKFGLPDGVPVSAAIIDSPAPGVVQSHCVGTRSAISRVHSPSSAALREPRPDSGRRLCDSRGAGFFFRPERCAAGGLAGVMPRFLPAGPPASQP